MLKVFRKRRGVALFLTLATLLGVVILANIILVIMKSQSRLTQRQVNHIQAYYAAQAGMIYALENLRTGSWAVTSCPPPNGCNMSDSFFPANIRDPLTKAARQVRVIICPAGTQCQWATSVCNPPAGSGINYCINTTVNYTAQ